MRIKELQLFGFKSFPNKTTIKFSEGITAIIGPNGCGKTNILDALRWVLGEQSFSILRCNKNEELIFGGTAKYPPLGYTEVKLILENDCDLTNLGAEVEIKRKYFRSGESEYYINRNPCRLKDIQDIFLNSGTGTKAYSIFDLKQIREIISGGVKKMFDEAANLAKYRGRKNETMQKLALTESELLRLNDVIAERERYTRSLKRQARRLEVYERLREEEKKLKLVSLKTQYRTVKDEEEQSIAFLKNAAAKEEAALLEISQDENELERIRQQLRELRTKKENLTKELEDKRDRLQEQEKTIISKREHINYLNQEIERLRREIETLQKKMAGSNELAQGLEQEVKTKAQTHEIIKQELERIRSQVREEEEMLFNQQLQFEQEKNKLQGTTDKIITLRQKQIGELAQSQNLTESENKLKVEIENLAARICAIQSDIAQNEKRIGEIDDKLAEMRSSVSAQNSELERFNKELKDWAEQKRVRQEAISLLKQEIKLLRTTLGKEQKEIVKAKLGEDFLGSVQDFLMVRDGYERPVEAALYTILDFLVVKKCIEPTDFKSDARFGFLLAQENNFQFSIPNSQIRKSDGVLGQLKDFVEIKTGAPKLLQMFFHEFFLVENFPKAWELSKQFPQFSFVTADGIALFNQGMILIESQEQGKLRTEKKLVEKEEEKVRFENELANMINQIIAQEATIVDLKQELERMQGEILNLLSERSNLQAALSAKKNSSDEIKKELDWLKEDFAQTQARINKSKQNIDEVTQSLNELDDIEQPLKVIISSLEKEIVERQKQIKAKLEEASKVLFNLGKIGEELTLKRTELAYQIKETDLAQQRITELAETQKRVQAEMEKLTSEIESNERQIEENRRVIKLSCQAIDELTIDELSKAEEEIESTLKEKRDTLEIQRAELMKQRMKQFEKQKHREAIEQEAREFYQTDIAAVEIVPDEQVTERLKVISERVMNLGKVNPLAKDEFQREKAELDNYLSQRQDVLDARSNLEKTITEIEQHAKEQFLDTFRLVRERFRSIFTRLFIEGEADLSLLDQVNPLDSEIEITARPKGKMPKRLEHLSDGEKALLALSLLFAFYSVKPAPFCFFDEVDAPLDDVNVGRFADFLRELAAAGTQGVVITHNRLTIEKADVLLGVTTEEPGVSKVISVRLSDYKPEKNEVRF
ncbi:MAG: chromosome segregation protein SMC [candidate division WOR-3 bacterium]|nr:chromosome segregation protein SMC [candidate division WOR-3 bacterium]